MTERFPGRSEWLPVYAMICIVVYPWAILGLMRDYAARWSLYMDWSDLLAVTAYTLLSPLIEAGFVLVVLLLAGALLPAAMLRSDFAVRGSLTALSFLVTAAAVTLARPGELARSQLNVWLAISVAAAAGSSLAANRSVALHARLKALATQGIALAYFFTLLGVLGLAVVVIRNVG